MVRFLNDDRGLNGKIADFDFHKVTVSDLEKANDKEVKDFSEALYMNQDIYFSKLKREMKNIVWGSGFAFFASIITASYIIESHFPKATIWPVYIATGIGYGIGVAKYGSRKALHFNKVREYIAKRGNEINRKKLLKEMEKKDIMEL